MHADKMQERSGIVVGLVFVIMKLVMVTLILKPHRMKYTALVLHVSVSRAFILTKNKISKTYKHIGKDGDMTC